MEYDAARQCRKWVLATGKSITVKEFVELAFKYVDLEPDQFIKTSDRYFRPNEVEFLLGDSSKAKEKLNWEAKTDIDTLVKLMVDSDINLAKREQILLKENLIKPTWENQQVRFLNHQNYLETNRKFF